MCLPRRPGGSQVLKPGLVKGQWSTEEDDRLVGLVEKGFRNWGQVTIVTPSPAEYTKQHVDRVDFPAWGCT